MSNVQEVSYVLVMCVVHVLRTANVLLSLILLIAMRALEIVLSVKKTHNVVLL
jgi:hypothetical protein